MVTTYILILCVSAWLASFLLLTVSGRLAVLMNGTFAVSAGLVAGGVAIAFLTIAAAPAAMLVGAAVLLAAPWLARRNYLPRIAQWGVPFIAAMLAVSELAMPTIAGIPPIIFSFVALLAAFGMLYGASSLPIAANHFSMGLLTCLLPLLAAPFMGAPSYIALDIALIGSALLGVLMQRAVSGELITVRAPLMLIAFWLIVTAALSGAWIPAAVSALLTLAFIGHGLTQPARTDAA